MRARKLPEQVREFGNPWMRPVSSATWLALPGFEPLIVLDFLGISRQNQDFSNGYAPCTPAKNTCALFLQPTLPYSVKCPVPLPLAHILIAPTVAFVLISSKINISLLGRLLKDTLAESLPHRPWTLEPRPAQPECDKSSFFVSPRSPPVQADGARPYTSSNSPAGSPSMLTMFSSRR